MYTGENRSQQRIPDPIREFLWPITNDSRERIGFGFGRRCDVIERRFLGGSRSCRTVACAAGSSAGSEGPQPRVEMPLVMRQRHVRPWDFT